MEHIGATRFIRNFCRIPTGPVILIILLLFLTGLPLGWVVFKSFESPSNGALTFDGYRHVFDSSSTVLVNTFVVALGHTFFAALIAYPLAWLVTRTNAPYKRLLELLIVLPFFIPPLVSSMAWVILGNNRTGLINVAWRLATGSKDGLVNIYSLPGVTWGMMQYAVPFLFLLTCAGMRQMSRALEEASEIAGASKFKTSLRITLPLLTPILTSAVLMSVIHGFEDFESPLLLGTPANIHVVTTAMYDAIFSSPQVDYQTASAFGVILMLVMVPLIIAQFKLLSYKSFVTVGGKAESAGITRFGKARWPIFGVVSLYVLLTVAAPIGSLLYGTFVPFVGLFGKSFTLEHYRQVLNDSAFFASFQTSLKLGAITATITMSLALAIGYVALRGISRLRRIPEFLAWLPWLMPGIVLGVGMLWAYITLPSLVSPYGTAWALALAYVTLGIPLASRIGNGALVQVGRELEECARVHGASRLRAILTTVLPVIAVPIMIGWILLFSFALRELSASILLYSSGNIVLSVYMLQMWQHGNVEGVCVVSMFVLIVVMALLFAQHRLSRRSGSSFMGV